MSGRPRVGSLFSGVGGLDMGLEAGGFEVAWQVEIDNDAVSVLERHYPTVRRYRDVREVNGAELPAVDVLVGGFPCQDLSVAGARKGLAGARSGLFFEVVRIARESAAPWLLLENVDGLLSQWTPIEAPPSGVAVGTEWEVEESPDLGLVISTLQEHGYLGCLRVLDAQHFGVAQRRERVFIVGHLGTTGARALEVLLEPESVLRDLASCLASREGTAGVPENGAGSGGLLCQRPGRDERLALAAGTGGPGSQDYQQHAAVVSYVPAVSGTLTAAMDRDAHNGNDDGTPGFLIPTVGGSHGRIDAEGETFVVANSIQASEGHHGRRSPRGDGSDNLIVDTLRSHPRPGSNSVGAIVAAFDERNVTSGAIRTRCEPGLPANTLHQGGQAVAFNWQAGGGGNDDSFRGKSRQYIERAGDYAGALSATRVDAVAFTNRGEAVEGAHETLRAASHGALPMVAQASVRRLMPVECERLQGWPDGHTERRADGSLIPDGPRYRMIGNGVVAPVAAWIGRRLRRAMEAAS